MANTKPEKNTSTTSVNILSPYTILKTFNDLLFIASSIIETYFKGAFKWHAKPDTTLVSEVDQLVELAIRNYVSKHYPTHAVVGEEYSTTTTSNVNWIVDPIDGTNNFIKGAPYFSVSIALEVNSQIVAGAIMNPITKETYMAVKGFGAYKNNKPIHPTKVNSVENSIIAINIRRKYEHLPYDVPDLFFKLHKRAIAMRRVGSTALDIARVAEGLYDAFIVQGINYWDIAAGYIILKEAGGEVVNWEGEKPTPSIEKNYIFHNGYLQEIVSVIASTKKV